MAKYLTIILTLLLFAGYTRAGNGGEVASVKVMQRVDIANHEVAGIVATWIDSLEHWRGVGPEGDPAQDRTGVPGSTESVIQDWFSQSTDVIAKYPPTVLSVEPSREGWLIRTLFSTTDASTGHVVPLGILRSHFIKDSVGRWLLTNPLMDALAQRPATVIDMVTYSHAEDAEVNSNRAGESSRFLRTTAERFGVDVPSDVTMVLASDRDEMCALLGLEYYAFPPTGLAYPDRMIILSSLGDPFYPHELAHIVLRPLERDAHPIIREGVATWLGGSIRSGMTQMVQEYLATREPSSIPTFLELFTNAGIDQDDQYILGAAICATVARSNGDEAVKRLLAAHTSSEVMLLVSSYLQIDPSDQHGSMLAMLHDVVANAQAKPGQ